MDGRTLPAERTRVRNRLRGFSGRLEYRRRTGTTARTRRTVLTYIEGYFGARLCVVACTAAADRDDDDSSTARGTVHGADRITVPGRRRFRV